MSAARFDRRAFLKTAGGVTAGDFVMTDWHVYSTRDTVHWTDHRVRMSLADFRLIEHGRVER